MKIRKSSYFSRLLFAFLFGGFVPFLMMSLIYISTSTKILEDIYERRSKQALQEIAASMHSLIENSGHIAQYLAKSTAIKEYAAFRHGTPAAVSAANQALSAQTSDNAINPYIIPVNGAQVLSHAPPPDEYRLPLYSGWGIIGALSRRKDCSAVLAYAQPHPEPSASISLAVGTKIFHEGSFSGYVIVDVDRSYLDEHIGQIARSSGTLSDLVLFDHSGCIIYHMANRNDEAGFSLPFLHNGSNYIITREKIGSGMEAVGFFPAGALDAYGRSISKTLILISGLSMLLFLGMAVFTAQSISRPVHMLSITMQQVSLGHLDVICPDPAPSKSHDEISMLILQFNQMIGQVNDLVHNKIEQERNLRLAEIQNLQSQINPHFIYNTLNSIRSIARLRGETEISGITTSLAKIIRKGTSGGEHFCTLAHSLEIARDYFNIESWRWPERFSYKQSVPESLLCAKIPNLIIQPIVENALSHGLETKTGSGSLAIAAEEKSGILLIMIDDDGIGIPADELERIRKTFLDIAVHKGMAEPSQTEPKEQSALFAPRHGIGLINTHRRLVLIYGPDYGLDISSASGIGTRVAIRIPFCIDGENQNV